MAHFASKTDGDIDQWIKNYEKEGKTGVEFYRELLEERARRTQEKQALKLEISLNHLKEVAKRKECTTYGELAAASGIEWKIARHQMNGAGGHLDRLLDICYARGLPLLAALCVNQGGLEKGELEETALAGFVAGAKRLGLSVTDARAFHHQCRDECWAWGQQDVK